MQKKFIFLSVILVFLSFTSFLNAQEETLAQIKETFKQPGRDYSTGPLWTWNDLLTEEQIRSTLQDMASQHVKQVWVHPRPGLMTPYLSDDWFRLWGVALDEAEKLDMNVWIYDENSYPSGFAGGFVPEAMPESRGKGLHLQRVNEMDELGENIAYVFKITRDVDGKEKFTNVTVAARDDGNLGDGEWLIGKIQLAGTGGWFGGWWYVDLLHKGVTEKFIELTMEPYREHFEKQFGKRLPGWFTDEPHLQTAGGLTWNDEIPVLFEQKYGYSLVDNLPSMTMEVGDWKKVRHDYHQLMLELFIDRWAKPCFEYCEKNNLEFTGHYWEHGWPGTGGGPDNMAMYAWHQRPSIDTLMNRYDEGVNAQFGNARSVKEMMSVANQMGYKRTLSETYGAGGWDLRFEDMKRIADWQYALGVNTTNEHVSYVTIRGARKRDHPQSFSYHSSWWDAYHVMADYNTRLAYALTRGEQINHVLLIEPTSTAWMYQGHPHLGKVGNDFQNLVNQFERWQVEYDLGCEDIIARWGKVEDGKFVVNKRAYDLVILPPNMENINGKVLELIKQYIAEKGELYPCSVPTRVDGMESEVPKALLPESGNDLDAAFFAKKRTIDAGFQYSNLDIPTYRTTKIVFETRTPEELAASPTGKVFHHRRIVDGGEILFLCNTDIAGRAVGTVTSHMKSVEQWCLETGAISPYQYQTGEKGGVSFKVNLPPCGSLLLFLSNKPAQSGGRVANVPSQQKHQPVGETKAKRLEPNVLTLDYVDVNIDGEGVWRNVYTYEANKRIWQKHGFNKNPWDNEVQFKDQLITKTFPEESGFSATYKFTLADQVPNPLFIVIERSDLYAITCNGNPVAAKEGDWWLDKSFGKVDISTAAKVGDNEVTITAKPMTMWHELESAYLLGDFSLEPASKGFTVTAAKPLELCSLDNTEQGHTAALEWVSWLSSGVGFPSGLGADHKDDYAPFLVFDLGAEKKLTRIKIWNYNEVNLTKRGVKELKIYGDAKDGELLGTFTLTPGSSDGPQILPIDKGTAHRYIVFEIVSNLNGITFPVSEDAKNLDDDAFVGLAEVKFFTEDSEITGVKIHQVSSELVTRSHNRKADYLLDGSGLIPVEPGGWNIQGMPFYMGGVSYTETFDLGNITKRAYQQRQQNGRILVRMEPASKYVVSLGKWYGSVAKVIVNGQEAGYIGYAPWECDISKFVKNGRNEISVVVIGTPKNLLGPHHIGALRGSAWPNAFWGAPQDGPPPGTAYDVIGYGMFEPFVVIQK